MKDSSSVFSEIAAGAVTACVMLPLSVAAGILVYSQFGGEFVALGALAGLITAIAGGAICAAVSGSALIKSIPIKSALIQSSIVGAMAASLGDERVALVAFPFCIILAGIWQIGLALSGLAKVVKMTPYPVVAGFVTGVGLLIILAQIPVLFGVASLADITRPDDLSFQRLFFGAGVVAIMFALDRWAPKMPSPLVGLIMGYAVYHSVGFLVQGVDIGPVIGAVDIGLWTPVDVSSLIAYLSADGAEIWPILIGGSLVLALAGILDTAVAVESLRSLSNVSIDQKRDLTGQGAASMIVAGGGGFFVTNSLVLTATNYHAGGRTRWSALLAPLFLLAGVALFPEIISSLPIVVLAAILVYVGYKLIDRWVIRVCRESVFAASSPVRRQARRNAVIATVVMMVTVLERPLLGAAVGAVLACAVFVAQMNRPAVRDKSVAKRRSSKRKRSSVHEALLAETSSRLAVFRLQGVLFFGNADDVRSEIDALPESIRTLILDFRDVTDIDVSGAVALRQVYNGSRKDGRRVLFSNLRNPNVEHAIAEIATDGEVFADLDAALEHFEDETLSHPHGDACQLEVSLVESDFGKYLEPDEIERLSGYMRPVRFSAGEAMCRAGDPADRMWVLMRGSVSVAVSSAGGQRRLADVAAGCLVGEMGFLEHVERSADVLADEEVHACELTEEAYRKILSECPPLGHAVLRAIACELSERLRLTSEELLASIDD